MIGEVVDAAMQVLGEMLGPEEIGHAIEGVIIDEDRAEQRLFGLDIMRREAKAGLDGGIRAGGKADSFSGMIDRGHWTFLDRRDARLGRISSRSKDPCDTPSRRRGGHFS